MKKKTLTIICCLIYVVIAAVGIIILSGKSGGNNAQKTPEKQTEDKTVLEIKEQAEEPAVKNPSGTNDASGTAKEPAAKDTSETEKEPEESDGKVAEAEYEKASGEEAENEAENEPEAAEEAYEEPELPAGDESLTEPEPVEGTVEEQELKFTLSAGVYDYLNIRAEPSLQSAKLGRILPHQVGTVLEELGDFTRISFEGIEGFVASPYIVIDRDGDGLFTDAVNTQKPAADIPTAENQNSKSPADETRTDENQASEGTMGTGNGKVMVLIKSPCNIRSGPGMDYSVLGMATAGSEYECSSDLCIRGWNAIILSNGSIGYVGTNYSAVI